ncbi:MAG TPA: hypothetical protein PKC41_09135, partial [Chitinophagaceae bacterium]|nr:hypothetical protein [Chitinophagaceae bacterium]
MAVIKKIVDTATIQNSRADSYWNENGFDQIYRYFRKGVDIPLKMRQKNNALDIQKYYQLAGFQFGNWTSNEDRYNYLCALYIALYDMNKVLKFHNNNIGFKALSVAFGARGVSSALAHYESYDKVINITRYERNPDNTKVQDFIASGGIGAFAHEYAHFLDYYIGQYYELKAGSIALTDGRSINRSVMHTKGLRGIADEILQLAFWKAPNKESDLITRI